MITRLLVANRGEIARRVFRTCRDLGVQTVAVYSDADADASYVREADAAVHLPGVAAADTYLRADLLVEAAVRAGADAMHPGYGFLSESSDFARQVAAAGLTWVGPPAEAVEAMGSKVAARRLMAEVGVPVLPELDPATVGDAELPVLVKASAGGGGRGMRVVRDLGTLREQVAEASAEAASAFGDPTVFCEPFLESGRHIEMQVLADTHGNVWVLGERDCSIQRRHQKMVEETPSPVVDEALRAELTAATETAAKAVAYVGAGTVEFLVDADGSPHFLEMNTRLQVEHPVTECAYGVDLVAEQIAIAEGAALTGQPASPKGHAIEARLYAEDPARDWLAQSGTVHRFDVPDVDAEFAVPAVYGLRVDSGVGSGSIVSPHYDAMLAKLVAWGPTRTAAARRLSGALASARIHGITTNRDLLVRVLRDPEFLAGTASTAFLGSDVGRRLIMPPDGAERWRRIASLVAAIADAHRLPEQGNRVAPPAWRNVPSQPQRKHFVVDRQDVVAVYQASRGGLVGCDLEGVEVLHATGDRVTLRVDGVLQSFDVSSYPDGVVSVDSAYTHVDLRRLPRFVDPQTQVGVGSLLSPMPGSVVAVVVAEGDVVAAGQPILVIEAMKMQHTIRADEPGTVSALPVGPGQQVDSGVVLAVVTPEGDQP